MLKAFLLFLALGGSMIFFNSIVPVVIIIFLYGVSNKKEAVNELLNKKDSPLDISYHEDSTSYYDDNTDWSDGCDCYHDDCSYDSCDCGNDD